jgi:hypothetical protein
MLSGIGDTLNSGNDQANQQALQTYQQALQLQQANAATAAFNGQPYNPAPIGPPPVPQSFLHRLFSGLNGEQPAPANAPAAAPVAYNPPAASPSSSPSMQGVLPTAPGSAKGVTPEQSSTYGNARAWGLPHAGASAVVAGLSGESGASLDPNSQNNTGTDAGGVINPKGAFGIANWNGPRQAQLLNYARQTGGDPTSRATQTAFVQWDLQHNYPQLWQQLNDPNSSPQDNLTAFVNQYENPKDKAGAIAARMPYLSAVASLNGGQEQPAGVLGNPATRAPANLVAGPGVASSVSPDNVASGQPTPQITPTPDTSAPAVATAAAPAGTVSFGGRNYTLGQAYAMLQSPTMKPIGEALIKRFGEQTGQVAPMTPQQKTAFGIPAEDTRVWTINTQTGKPEAIASDKDTQTNEQKNYEYYKKQTTEAGGEPKTFEQWEAIGGVKGLQPHVVGAGAALVGPDGKVLYKGQGAASMPDQTADFLAERILAGDTKAMTGLGRGAQGAENISKVQGLVAQKAAERGIDAKDLLEASAEQAGLNAQQRTFGTQTARMASASTEAQGAIALGRQASNEVPRGNWVPVTKAIQAVQAGTSDPALAKFGAANLAIINTYARAINPNGTPTVSDKEHAQQMLSTATGPDAYNATLDQMQAEIDLAHKSPQVAQAMLKNIRKGKPAMEGISAQPLSPEAGVFTAGGNEQGAAPPQTGATATEPRQPLPQGYTPAMAIQDAKSAWSQPNITPAQKAAIGQRLQGYGINPSLYGLQ